MNKTIMYLSALQELKKECEEIGGQWNGDESGIQEERADTSKDIIEKCDEIINLINYLNEF